MKNTDLDKAFFALLRSGLWNTPVTHAEYFDKHTDWNAIIVLARKQTVLGLVADAVFRLEEERQPEQKVLLWLANMVSATARRHAVINDTLVKVVTRLEAEGACPVLLKGQGIAAIYHNPQLRMCGDIDLYVGIEDYTRACKVIMRINDKDIESAESEKHFHTTYNGVSVELHRIAERLYNPFQDARYQKWSKEGLKRENTATIQLEGTAIHIPSAEFNAIYIFNHLWHHFICGGVGLRQLCDWTMALHVCAGKCDQAQMKRHLKEFGLWEAWRTFGCIAVKKLGLSEEEFPFYDKGYEKRAGKILERILLEGNFGVYSPAGKGRPDGIIAGKLHSLRRITKRTAGLASVSPMRALEYYMYFIPTGVRGLFESLLGMKRSYMKQE